jgi:hypothetical protein
VQLSVHGAWQHVRADGAPWSSGWGDVELGARWRFLDDETDGVSMAVQPLWIKNWSSSARRRGLASEHAEYVLPVQVAHDFGTVAGGMEIARHFVASEPDAWQIGAYVERDCFKASECLGEIATEHTNGESTRTTLNFGGRVPLTRDAETARIDRQRAVRRGSPAARVLPRRAVRAVMHLQNLTSLPSSLPPRTMRARPHPA